MPLGGDPCTKWRLRSPTSQTEHLRLPTGDPLAPIRPRFQRRISRPSAVTLTFPLQHRRSRAIDRQLIRYDVLTSPEALNRAPVAVRVDRGVREELHQDLGVHGVVLQLAASAPVGTEVR